MTRQTQGIVPSGTGRERISQAAYELFSREGTLNVGIDSIIAKAGAAKMTLYRNFPSKNELILDFLRRREQLWTKDWLQAEVERRAQTPQGVLLAVFDVFAEWFASPEFDGCAFITTLIEYHETPGPVLDASVAHLANIRAFLSRQAARAGVADPDAFARQWHILMKGSIVAAHEGDPAAAGRARELGVLLLRSHGIDIDID